MHKVLVNSPDMQLLCCVTLMFMSCGSNRDLDKTIIYSFYIKVLSIFCLGFNTLLMKVHPIQAKIVARRKCLSQV